MTHFMVVCGLAIGNFLSNDFEIALERSYFQAVAVLVLWIISKTSKYIND